MKNVILYSRVSTDEQAEKGHSLQHQESSLHSFCTLKNLQVLMEVKEDFTGKHFKRPQWIQILDFLKKNRGKVDTILFLRWDRFARNLLEALLMIEKLKKIGVKVNSIENPINTDNPDELVMLSIYLAIPQVENEKNSIRTTEASRKARLEGCWTGTAPFGLKCHRTSLGKSSLITNEKTFIVQRIFNEMALGLCSAEELWKKSKKQYQLSLSKQAFLNMLRNVVYIGKIQVKAWKNYPEEQVIGLHAPIISEATFHKVQQQLQKKKFNRRISCHQSPDNLSEGYYLKGKLVCPVHGTRLTASASKGRSKYYKFYHCSDSRCKSRFRIEAVHNHMDGLFSCIQLPNEVLSAYQKMLAKEFEKADSFKKEELKKKQNALEHATKEKDSLMSYLLSGVVSKEDYLRTNAGLNNTIINLEGEIATLKETDSTYQLFLKNGFDLLRDMRSSFKNYSPEVKQKVIGSIFPEKMIFDGLKVRTARINEVVAVLMLEMNGLEIDANEKAGEIPGLVKQAPPAGLEPATL